MICKIDDDKEALSLMISMLEGKDSLVESDDISSTLPDNVEQLFFKIEKSGVASELVLSILISLSKVNVGKFDNITETDDLIQNISQFFYSSVNESSIVAMIQLVNCSLSNSFSTVDEVDVNENLLKAEKVYKFLRREYNSNTSEWLMQHIDISILSFWKKVFTALDGYHNHNQENPIQTTSISKVYPVFDVKLHESTKPSSYPNSVNDTESMIIAGDIASQKIYSSTCHLCDSLSSLVVPAVKTGIENVGEFAKQNIEPNVSCDEKEASKRKQEEEDPYVALSDLSVQATDSFRESVKSITFGIIHYSTSGVNKIAEKWEENEVGKALFPDNDLREMAVAVGKVGIATIGASTKIAETLFDLTKEVAQTSLKVGADVAQHKYGSDSNVGKIIENTGVATGNVLSSVTHIGFLEAQVLATAVVKNTSKLNMEETINNQNEFSGQYNNVVNLETQMRNAAETDTNKDASSQQHNR